MRIFAVSDLHLEYQENALWLANLSTLEYQSDVLIVAGDISSNLALVNRCFDHLVRCFDTVVFVPGNHDLWCRPGDGAGTSMAKYKLLRKLARECGIEMQSVDVHSVSIVPLFGWYDYSFGLPSPEVLATWMDYRACLWPDGHRAIDVADFFDAENRFDVSTLQPVRISVSHFLPRIDLMPSYVPHSTRVLFPALGSSLLEHRIRQVNPMVHVYGHSHLNRSITLDGVHYMNNAYGYPSETRIARKELALIYPL